MANTPDRMLAQALAGRLTRRGLIRGSLATGAGLVALSALGFAPQPIAAAGPIDEIALPLSNDLAILNYALLLEYLESDAYSAIVGSGVLSGRAQTYFRSFGEHEAEHAAFLEQAIRQAGGTPISRPTGGFNFSSVPQDPAAITRFFLEVENLGVSAYLGAAPLIAGVDILEAALKIHAVEAEHASALASLVDPMGNMFAPFAFQPARTPEQVVQSIMPFLQPQQQMPGLPNTGGGFAARAGGGGGGLLQP